MNDGQESCSSTLADEVEHSSDGIATTHPPHRALEVFEILGLLFKHMKPATLAVTARVCRGWSDIALDVLWRDLDDTCCLFRLLGDLEENESEFTGDYVSPNLGDVGISLIILFDGLKRNSSAA